MDLKVRSESYANSDHSWLASDDGVDDAIPIELDLALFDFVTAFPIADGKLPSGITLAKVTATGRYGPYTGAGVVNEVKTITRTATGGTVDIDVDGEVALAVPVVAATTAAELQAEVDGLSNVDPGDLVIAGPAGGPWTVTSGGQFAGAAGAPVIDIDDTNATGGTVLIATTTAGSGETATNGLEVMQGHLLMDVAVHADNTTGRAAGALFHRGRVDESELPTNHGLNAAGKADVASHIRYE